jgi:hypothetical protein
MYLRATMVKPSLRSSSTSIVLARPTCTAAGRITAHVLVTLPIACVVGENQNRGARPLRGSRCPDSMDLLLPLVGGCIHSFAVPSVVYGFLGYTRSVSSGVGSSKVWGMPEEGLDEEDEEDYDLPYDEASSRYSDSENASSSGGSSAAGVRVRAKARAPSSSEILAMQPAYTHPTNRRYTSPLHTQRMRPDRPFAAPAQFTPARRAATKPPPVPVSRRPVDRHPLQGGGPSPRRRSADLSAFIGSPVASDTELEEMDEDDYPWAYDRHGRRRA